GSRQAGTQQVTGSEAGAEATDQAGSYALSETGGPSGYDASAWDCVGGGTLTGSQIEIGLGETVTCTITNDDKPASLILAKHVVNDNGGTADASAWNLHAGANTVVGSAAGKEATDQAGTYPLSEAGGRSGERRAGQA